MEAFAVRDLTFAYPDRPEPALKHVTFSLECGQFTALAGPSGCGKSTLLRQLKSALAPHGTRTGEILFEGRPLEQVTLREQSARIGFVQQDPDSQLVTDKVWHELAFGLESLGLDTPTIRARVAEMAGFFGIESWFYRDVAGLSGGQKQLLNLAAVMAMQPSVLILDEPTSQLDPIAAADFLATVGRIHRELGTTVLMTEHRLGEVFPLCDRVLVLDGGALLCDGTPREVGLSLRGSGHAMFRAMPVPMQIYCATDSALPCPVTVRDGRVWLEQFAAEHPLRPLPPAPIHAAGAPVIRMEDVWFRYEKDSPDVLRGLELSVGKGEFLAILGGNGAGKSTALSLLTGRNRPYRGRVTTDGTVCALPQNPQALFVKKTVREDLEEAIASDAPERGKRLAETVRLCRLGTLLERHPYDLSGGEQQRAALAKVLLQAPDILLLDEPTKGLDAEFKAQFAGMLRALLAHGVTVVMVSHDVEFCAAHAHRCALFFDGGVVSSAPPREFFSGRCFYTTAANRMARALAPEAVTAEDLILACGGEPPDPPAPPEGSGEPLPPAPTTPAREKLPLWRKLLAGLTGAVSLIAFAHAIGLVSLEWLFPSDFALYGVLLGALAVLAAAVSRREPDAGARPARRRLPKRTIAAAAAILLLIPLTIFLGVRGFGDRKYYFISLLVLLECMLPFFLVFEGRKPQARELVIIAVLCALGVAARAVLAMLPQCKPVIALTILSGVAFGGEAGFLVGAVTMLVSNVLFGQGPWTPWQMFAIGLIGLLAGVLYQKGLLRRSRLSLSVFGALSALIIFGGIMNPASALMAQRTITWGVLLAYYLSGLPMDLIQAAATALFLWFFALPMLEKLDRIKVKYGLIETK